MDEQDMKDTLREWAHAARMAIRAGFDGVEIHGANGYLLEYFLLKDLELTKVNSSMIISTIERMSTAEALRIELDFPCK
jgi:alkylation response protein AidB-like acyl-CoA dehydrogenase